MVQFAVTTRDGEWAVFRDAEMVKTGISRSAAVSLAEQLAYEAEERHEIVELLIQDYLGEVRRTHSGGD